MKLNKSLIAKSVAALAFVAGAAPAFAAAPSFTVDPSAFGNGESTFVANQMSGTSSELLHTTATGHYGSGWLQISSFSLQGTTVDDTGMGSGKNDPTQYKLYITFDLTDTYRKGTGGGINTPDSISDLTTLNFKFWVDYDSNNAYTAANALTGAEATVGNVGDDRLLGEGTLISGVAGFNEEGGAHLNSTQTFSLTALGQQYFIDPKPFYNIAFDEFNNTKQGALVNGNLVSINSASGLIDFNRSDVPEPASLALMGLGMLGLAAGTRRRRNK